MKLIGGSKKSCSIQLQSLWNPFRDWNNNDTDAELLAEIADGFKASETLLGIETQLLDRLGLIEPSFKASETLLGIETNPRVGGWMMASLGGFKASETLLGIETLKQIRKTRERKAIAASKPLKPF